MKEYIERAEALDICQKEYEDRLRMADYCGDTVAWDIGGAIKGIPAADVAEVRHGRWVNPHWRNSDFACNCSACGVEAIHREYRWHERGIYPICPNCGARMYKEADHEVSEP